MHDKKNDVQLLISHQLNNRGPTSQVVSKLMFMSISMSISMSVVMDDIDDMEYTSTGSIVRLLDNRLDATLHQTCGYGGYRMIPQ